jgi:superfamily II DNA/RNA helicase
MSIYNELFTTKTKIPQQPTPIQSQSWSLLLIGRDIIGIAPKSSGKSFACLIPALWKVSYMKQQPSSSLLSEEEGSSKPIIKSNCIDNTRLNQINCLEIEESNR